MDPTGDVDAFRVNLTPGQNYTLALNGRGGTSELSDPLVALYNSSGAFISSNDDGGPGLDSLPTHQATYSGLHNIAATGFGDDTGQYPLLVV